MAGGSYLAEAETNSGKRQRKMQGNSGHSGWVTDAAVATISELLADAERCAAIAGLRYVDTAEPGLSRRRRGRGFSYVDAAGRVVDVQTRERIRMLVIPPAWRQVWICTDPDAHLLATGYDDRGRRQYLYHPRWREARDVINGYRLIEVGPRLPTVRAEVKRQLSRRDIDRAVMLAAMVRIVDRVGIRVGNEVYAEENDSVGLCTLNKRHVSVDGRRIRLRFPAKSGLAADLSLNDADVARVVRELLPRRGRRLFALDGRAVTPDELNRHLAALTDGVVTAKDFRTWRGTRVAFEVLRRPGAADREQRAIEAVDAAAEALGNTRAVARAHYVHPDMLAAWLDGTFEAQLAQARRVRSPGLDPTERALLGLLEVLLRHRDELR